VSVFRGRVKAFLFRRSDLSRDFSRNFCSACAVTLLSFSDT